MNQLELIVFAFCVAALAIGSLGVWQNKRSYNRLMLARTEKPVVPAPTNDLTELEEGWRKTRDSMSVAYFKKANPEPLTLTASQATPNPGASYWPGDLSERESEILRALAAGLSNKGIARELGITEATVKVHVRMLLRKMQVSNRTQAVIVAFQVGGRRGLVREDAPLSRG